MRAERGALLFPPRADVIGQMLDDGLIEESARRPAPELDDERRTYYRLTALGRSVIRAEATRLATLVSHARAKKLVYDPASAGRASRCMWPWRKERRYS